MFFSSPASPRNGAFDAVRTGHWLGAIAAMAAVVAASNWLVQFAINDWLTWGAFSYPVAYLVSDLVNRRFGPAAAQRVAWCGFVVALGLSLALAPARIALASACAFIVSQVLDIAVFHRLRNGPWWHGPLAASCLAALFDTAVFWSLAFAGLGLPWLTWALGDLLVKLAVGLCLLLPFRLLMGRFSARSALAFE